ncbi:hypothetical protein H0H92_011784 [Tricholoma furcatifolium]|nr:hypothetical protein H0H92_011784 [Tricholoma furcatifolium]
MANLSSPSIPTVDNEGSINAADELKNEGNVYFRSSQWDQALAAYRSALGHLPKNTNSQTRDDASEELSKNEQEERIASSTDDQPSSQVEPDPVANLRAILNANIAACYVQLGEHKQAVDACSEALLDNPKYVKVLFRRAKSNEALDSWSSLTAAQEVT